MSIETQNGIYLAPHVSVANMQSPSSGRPVENQFIIYTDNGTYFQSYNVVVAFRGYKGGIVLDKTYWDYSKTTGKYRNQFLGESKRETEAKIKSGEYQLANLNK